MNKWKFRADLESWNIVSGKIYDILKLQNCPDNILSLLLLTLDEAVSNIIFYAYPHREGGEIELRMNDDIYKEGNITITLADSGIKFDPLDPEIAGRPHNERKSPGGWGIPIIKSNVDEAKYEYSKGKNYLTLIKYIRRNENVFNK